MKNYKHLTDFEREHISCGLSQKKPLRTIATLLNRSPSTISREIARQKCCIYQAVTAERRAKRLASKPRRLRKLLPDTSLWRAVVPLLHRRWSPDQIAVHLRLNYAPNMHISHEAIYQAIYVLPRGTLRQELVDSLRRSHRHRRRRRYLRQDLRGQIPNMVSIHDRPAEVETREVPGHWEGDLLIGKYHASAIGTLVERTSRKVLICRLEGRTSDDVVRAFERRIMEMPEVLRQTLTYDRGKEMSAHEKLAERTQLKIYFCDPQCPWQRGTNENTNSLVRDFFRKGTDFSQVSEEELLDVERKLNERPRKCLGYKTPDEVFYSYDPVALGS